MIIIAQEANKMDITLSILCYSVFNFTEQIKLCSALQIILKYITSTPATTLYYVTRNVTEYKIYQVYS